MIFSASSSEVDFSNFGCNDTLVWHNCGGSNWNQSSDPDHKNVLRSGPIECTGVSRICTNVTGPATISFWWKSDVANKKIGQLSFSASDTKYVCDSTGWTPILYSIWDNETYELTWEFRKIRCYPKNTGSGWIGDVYIEYGELIIPHGFKTQISEPTTSSLNISVAPTSTTSISPEVKILPTNGSMDISEVKISSDNIKIIETSAQDENQPDATDKYITPVSDFSAINRTNVTEEADLENHNYTTINEAIRNVKAGGIVVVEKKSCNEQIIINKSIYLTGLNNPLIFDDDCSDIKRNGVILIDSSNVTIIGFKIKGYSENMERGSVHKRSKSSAINASPRDDNHYINIAIKNITIVGSNCGVDRGLYLERCNVINLSNINISNPKKSGITLFGCSYCELINNNVSCGTWSPADYGFYLDSCCNLNISENRLINVEYGFGVKNTTIDNITSANQIDCIRGDNCEIRNIS